MRRLTNRREQPRRSFWRVLKWRLSRNPKRRAKREDTFRLGVRPVSQPPPPDRDWLIWLGHASFLLRIAGRTLLFDPCTEGPRFLRRLLAAGTPVSGAIRVLDPGEILDL